MKKKDLKKFLKKRLIRYFWIFIFVIILLILSGRIFTAWFSKYQIMNHLDYNITLNEDGSATIVETWDVNISHTNTLFRNFEVSNKYGDIDNVSVKDLTTNKNLKQIYKEMYHVTTDCFYAMNIESGKYEIAWGTGMEDKNGRKTYQITYTVSDVIDGYDGYTNRYQEFYWKLLDLNNEIPVKKVTGTIKLPKAVENKENLKVWGHGPLNGKIEITSNDTINFDIKNLGKWKMLEIRVLTLEQMFNSFRGTSRNIEEILNEENNWSNETNNITETFYEMLAIIYIIAIIINIKESIKFYKITKNKDDGIIHRDLKYFRDIPREGNSTPPEAAYLYYFEKDNDDLKEKQSNIVSSILLDLALKKYIELRTEGEKVYITILKDSDGLNEDEKSIYNLLKGANKKLNEEFEIKEINKFAKKDYYKYSELINKMINEARESIYRQKLVDKANKKAYIKSKNAKDTYSFVLWLVQFIIIGFLVGLIPIFEKAYILTFGIGFKGTFITNFIMLFPVVITLLLKLKIRSKAQNKISVLTQKGTEEQEEWKGLANYLEDFSAFDKKGVPELVLWEKYLVYATAFGMADKVIKQMKAKYPEVFVEEYWSDEQKNKYQVLNFATNNIIYYSGTSYSPIESISKSANSAYKTSLSEIARHSSSSGSGGGGGFSGGGRRPEVAEAGMGGR